MITPQLGKLERVDLRHVWENESSHFTPWLAKDENIRLLGEAIGLELEVASMEEPVGPFSADILCKNAADDSWVLIENQIERTDHKHLGQIMTYAAGLKAASIVWIAQKFTEEHRAALDWLNEITQEQFSFFGLEIELWRIGDSAAAPKFNIVVQPNDWTKEIREATTPRELTDMQNLKLDFWTQFREHMQAQGSTVRCQKPSPQHWMNHSIGRSIGHLSSIASLWDSEAGSYQGNELRVELILDKEGSKEHFQILRAREREIEQELGTSLSWHNPEDARTCRISVRRPATLTDRSQWPEYHAWLRTNLEAFHRVFSPLVRALP